MSETSESSSINETKIPPNNEILYRETDILARNIIGSQARQIYDTATKPDGNMPTKNSIEMALATYHKIGEIEAGSGVFKEPIDLTEGEPLILYGPNQTNQTEIQDYVTQNNEGLLKFQIKQMSAVFMQKGEKMASIILDEILPQGVSGEAKHTNAPIIVPLSRVQDAQFVAEYSKIQSSHLFTDDSTAILKAQYDRLTRGTIEVPTTINLKQTIENVAKEQGQFLNQPLIDLLNKKKSNLNESDSDAMQRIEEALKKIEGQLIATPEGYAAVMMALGPTEIETAMTQGDMDISTAEATLKNLKSNGYDSAIIKDQEKKIQDLKIQQERRKKALELFKDDKKLTEFMRVVHSDIQACKIDKNVVTQINNFMKEGKFSEGMEAMVMAKFNNLSKEMRDQIWQKLGADTLKGAGIAGVSIFIILLLMMSSASKS